MCGPGGRVDDDDVCGRNDPACSSGEFGKTAKVWDQAEDCHHPRPLTFAPRTRNPTATSISCATREGAVGCRIFNDGDDDANGHWASRSVKGLLNRQYGLNTRASPTGRGCRKGHTPAGGDIVRDGSATHAWRGRSTIPRGAFGNTDAGFVWATGKLLLKVPETMHFRLEGQNCSRVSWPRTSSCIASARLVLTRDVPGDEFDGRAHETSRWTTNDHPRTWRSRRAEERIFEFDEQTRRR